MSVTDPSLLGFALLGLLKCRQPCSGYDLRMIFARTPMGTFSDSPGAIYPALRRLEAAGLIRGTVDARFVGRPRKLYRLSAKGETALRKWLTQPVTQRDVIRGMADLSLRFSFMEQALDRDACVAFLESLVGELERYLPTLHEHLRSRGESMSTSGSLALQAGIMGYESQLAWARMALEHMTRGRDPRGVRE
jgi:DNA-binding PadR family transcriptional regulator